MERLNCSLTTRFIPEIHSKDGVTRGKEPFFLENWTLVRPAGTETPPPGGAVNVHCPGCGAPLALYKTAKCPMCGTLTRVPDFSWLVSSISVKIQPRP